MAAILPTIYLIAGCNGAGKTTFAREFLLKAVGCGNFLNAGYLALGLSPLSPETAAMKAGRLLLGESYFL
jgi:predicted ABC-type ATPase